MRITSNPVPSLSVLKSANKQPELALTVIQKAVESIAKVQALPHKPEQIDSTRKGQVVDIKV